MTDGFAAKNRELYISLSSLSKTYEKGSVLAVDKVSFDVSCGEIFGMIGPDGAGKTSIFRMLTTLLLPDGGSATVLDNDIVKDYRKIRSQVGYMPGRFSLYQDLSIEENLNFYATIFGTTIEENFHLIKDIYVQIESFKKRKAGNLSGGMKQKLALCCALIHKPKVLFLDEPTTGIDPVSRKELWEMLRKLKSQDIAILVSTPYMDEALQCDRIGLMKNGKMMMIGTPQRLIANYEHPLYAVSADNTYHLLQALEKYPQRVNSYAFGETAHVIFAGEESELVRYLQENNLTDIQLQKIQATIEDCFIALSE
ncbi:MAG: ABC transporter ATP-binding protein [Paludibacteraceae bacterium]